MASVKKFAEVALGKSTARLKGKAASPVTDGILGSRRPGTPGVRLASHHRRYDGATNMPQILAVLVNHTSVQTFSLSLLTASPTITLFYGPLSLIPTNPSGSQGSLGPLCCLFKTLPGDFCSKRTRH